MSTKFKSSLFYHCHSQISLFEGKTKLRTFIYLFILFLCTWWASEHLHNSDPVLVVLRVKWDCHQDCRRESPHLWFTLQWGSCCFQGNKKQNNQKENGIATIVCAVPWCQSSLTFEFRRKKNKYLVSAGTEKKIWGEFFTNTTRELLFTDLLQEPTHWRSAEQYTTNKI